MAFSVVRDPTSICSLLLHRSKAINKLQNSFTPTTLHDHSPFKNNSLHVSDPLTLRNTFCSNKLLAKYVTASSLKTINAEGITEPAEGRFSQSFWDDALFTADNQIEETYAKDVQKLKEKVRGMILDKESDSSDKMILIDLIERLGLGHHFKKEIEDQIQHIYEFQAETKGADSNLFTTALHFRLFRQHGIDAPSNVFQKFMDEASGAFKEIHSKDIKGLLSFFEATHLRYQGEDILKEGNVFASHHLKQAIPQLDSHLQELVIRALRQPAHWGNPRIEARSYISFYNKEKMKNELLLKFATLDFNLVQNLYRHEICMLLRWWKGLNLQSKLPYIRNRMVEVYFWAMTVASEPQLSFARVSTARGLMLYVAMNDTADGYGDLEGITMFFNILQQRLDDSHVDQLPDGLRIACKAILNTFEELDRIISRQGRPYAVPRAREALKNLAFCYLRMAMWYKGVATPTFHETISYAHDDTAMNAVAAACLMSMESAASEEAMEWLLSASTIARASGLYVRCTNNIASYEKEDGLQGTSIDCYMKEHQTTKEEAVAKLRELAEDALMTINKEWVSAKHVPKDIMCRPVNYARAAYVSYLGGFDGFTDPRTVNVLKNEMAAIFIHPVTVD